MAPPYLYSTGIDMKSIAYMFLFITLTLCSCKKEINNPYDDLQYPDINGGASGNNPDPASIAGLHQNIFKPTCANSGCHDGTFEPDYRTIESTYNTLVLQPVIKNTADNSFQFRVKPFDTQKSMLYYRLTENLGGNSGIMPLVVDPGSDWNSKKAEHLANIKKWIDNGAPDLFGKVHTSPNKEPQLSGVMAFSDGSSSPLPRESSGGPIIVPANATELDIWFAVSDDSTAVSSLAVNEVKLSVKFMNDFSAAKDTTLEVESIPIQGSGYYAGDYSYYHHLKINPTLLNAKGYYVFLRIYVKDPSHETTELPENGSPNKFKTYACLKIL